MNILILCTANQCRSPMAEGLLRARAADAGVAVNVSSAGVMHGGAPATPDAVEVLADMGIDIGGHVSRRFDHRMLDEADLIVAMTREHLREAVVTNTDCFPKVFTLRELVRRLGDNPGASLATLHLGRQTADYMKSEPADDVSDPIGRPKAVYVRTANELDELVTTLVKSLETL